MIKFVYFDVGGVVISDFSGTDNWIRLKEELGVTSQMDDEFTSIWEPYEQEVVIGKDIETFIPILRSKLGLDIPKDYSFLNAFVSRFSTNKPTWPIVERAKQKHGVGLLTNMYPGILDAIIRANLPPPIKWDTVIESSIEGLKKPDPKFFSLAEQKAKVSGNEILFIENTIGNVEDASAYGWHVYHYDASDHQDSCRKLVQYLEKQKVI
jgi:FMN phosphatase YigB (HAD superfamily)